MFGYRNSTLPAELLPPSDKWPSRENDAINAYLASDEQRVKENGETGGIDTTIRQIRTLRRSNLTHPLVEAKLAGMAQRGSPDILSDQTAMADQVARLDLYKNLKSESKNTLLSYVKKEDADYAEAYYQAQRYLGMSQEEALNFAYRSANLDSDARARVSRERDKIDSAVKIDNGGLFRFLGSSSPVNSEMVRERIVDLASRYVATGVETSKAINVAKEVFEESTLIYNGVIVDVGTSSARAAVPEDFKAAVDAQVENFLEVSKNKDIDKSEVSVIQMGDDGRFVLVDKDDLLPVTDDQGRTYRFTMRDLRDWEVETVAERESAGRRASWIRRDVETKGYVRAVDNDGSENWIDPKTREVIEMEFPEGRGSVLKWKKTGRRYQRSVVVETDGSFYLHAAPRKVQPVGELSESLERSYRNHEQGVKRLRDFRNEILPSIKIGGYTLNE